MATQDKRQYGTTYMLLHPDPKEDEAGRGRVREGEYDKLSAHSTALLVMAFVATTNSTTSLPSPYACPALVASGGGRVGGCGTRDEAGTTRSHVLTNCEVIILA